MFDVLVAIMQIIFGIALLALVIAIAAYKWSVPFLAYRLAKMKILVIAVEENTGRWITKGGKAWRFITPGRETDPIPIASTDGTHNRWPLPTRRRSMDDRLINAEGEESALVDSIDKLLPGGIRWVGFSFLGYKIHEYNFRWNVLRESKPLESEDGFVEMRKLENGKYVVSFAKKLDYIYLRDSVYEFELNGAETKELMEVDIVILATLRVMDPYLTLFQVHDWLETSFDLIRPIVRSWVKRNCYDDVVGKPEVAEREFDYLVHDYTGTNLTQEQITALPIDRRPKTIADYIEGDYGVRCKRFGFDQVNPPDNFSIASTNRVVALQNKFTTITNAEATAKAKQIVAMGEAQALAKLIRVMRTDPNGLAVRKLEAMVEVSENGNLIITGEGANVLINKDKEPKKNNGGSK